MIDKIQPIKPLNLPTLKPIKTDSVYKKGGQTLKEWAMAGGGVPSSHKGRTEVWHKKAKRFAEGGEVGNTEPDPTDSGAMIEAPAFQKGGRVGAFGKLSEAFNAASKEADAVIAAQKAAQAPKPGVQYADPLQPATMRLSEALGNAGAEGKTLNFTEADRSRVFGKNRGGVGFSDLQNYSLPHKEANTVWGFGNKATAEKKIRQNDPGNSLFTTFVGSPTQHRSNSVVIGDAIKKFQSSVKKGVVPREQIMLMNKRLNELTDLKTGERVFQNGFDLTDPSALSVADTFSRRAAVGDVMLGLGVKGPMSRLDFKAEFPDTKFVDGSKIENLLKRETDPDLVDAGTYDVGNRLFVLDGKIIERPDLNEAFPIQVTGTDLGMKYQLVPPEKAMRDFYKEREGRLDKNQKPSPVSYYDLSRAEPSQFVDEDYLMFLQKEGYKRGGSVTQTPNKNQADGKYADGGLASQIPGQSVSAPPADELSKTKLMAEILARKAKSQGRKEIDSLQRPRSLTDLLNRGVIAPAVGMPVDLINMGLEGVDAVRDLASGRRVENRFASEKPFLGSEYLKDVMDKGNMTSGEERPMMEMGLSFLSPAGLAKGVAATGPKATGALSRLDNINLNDTGKITPPLTEAKTATAGTPQGAKYATEQDGPFLRVRPTALDPNTAKNSGIREASGLSSQRPIGAGAEEVRDGLPQRYSTEEVDRIVKDPALNKPLQIAQRYTQETLGADFKAPDLPESTLAKQSAIARTHELALSDSPQYKSAVFDAYAQAMPDVLEQAGAKNYDDLMEKAYRQLAKETDAQFQVLPFNFSYHRGGEGNYGGTRELLEDLHGNRHMYVYQGGDRHDFLNQVDDVTGLNENEKFRAVHDAMGHGIYGNEFGPKGEETAWAIHQQMYSPLARLAMTAETRGQNSLVNYSPLNVDVKEDVAKLRELQVAARRRGDKDGERIATEAIRESFAGFQFAPQKSILLPPEFVDPKYAGGMPNYIQSMILPAKGTTTQSALTHFSNRPDLTMTDPSRYGTGIKGAEKARLENTQNPQVPRTYFYAGEPGTVAPEPGLGANRYRSESESLYDINADPLRFKALARESNRTPFTAKYNAGIRSQDQELTDAERMIREYGYEGYINPATTKPAAVLYAPKQVERRREGGLATVKAQGK